MKALSSVAMRAFVLSGCNATLWSASGASSTLLSRALVAITRVQARGIQRALFTLAKHPRGTVFPDARRLLSSGDLLA
jgi:hypothetical protein